MSIETLLTQAVQQKASDLHISADMPPIIRIDGELKPLHQEVISAQAVQSMLEKIMSPEKQKNFSEEWDVDFALALKDVGRFRVNVFRQSQGLAGAFRAIPLSVPSIADLQIPDTVKKLTQLEHGLVLITGPTGSGKSTTMAAMIDEINSRESQHIITIEDPIEFVFSNKQSLIQQRELGNSTRSFTHALRAALREDPDIIMVGEMRDLETIRLALTAAETGHLVFATLHTPSAAESIHRIVDVFPGDEKHLVRSMLADSLQAIVAQTLVKRVDQGRVAVMEIMLANSAIRNLIREDKIPQMASVIQTNAHIGMQTFEQHFKMLKMNKIIE